MNRKNKATPMSKFETVAFDETLSEESAAQSIAEMLREPNQLLICKGFCFYNIKYDLSHLFLVMHILLFFPLDKIVKAIGVRQSLRIYEETVKIEQAGGILCGVRLFFFSLANYNPPLFGLFYLTFNH